MSNAIAGPRSKKIRDYLLLVSRPPSVHGSDERKPSVSSSRRCQASSRFWRPKRTKTIADSASHSAATHRSPTMFEEDPVTAPVGFRVLPSLNLPVAVNGSVVPSVNATVSVGGAPADESVPRGDSSRRRLLHCQRRGYGQPSIRVNE
jgi:hypothetical protein